MRGGEGASESLAVLISALVAAHCWPLRMHDMGDAQPISLSRVLAEGMNAPERWQGAEGICSGRALLGNLKPGVSTLSWQ